MTPGPNELKTALQRLIDGNAGEADRDAVRTALNTGVLVTGKRAVAIGGDASDVIITTGEGTALGNLGIAYAVLGETRRAIQFYEQRLTIARAIGDRRGKGNALWNMSLALDQRGERAQAIQHAIQALTIYEQIEDPNTAKVRAQLAAWREQTDP